MLDLSLAINIGTRIGGFSPATLFAASEPGGWYDPSDLTTLFQDSTGTTPVTAAGQSVGLWLDKSQGLVLGPELVTNGGFSSATGWTLGGSGASISGGKLNLSAATDNAGVFQSNAAYASAYLEITVVIDSISSGAVTVTVGVSTPGPANTVLYTLPGTYTRRVQNTGDNFLRVYADGASTTAVVDSVSVRPVVGNHLIQSSLSNRPIYGIEPIGGRRNLLTYTEQFDNAAWSKAGGAITADATTSPDGTADADKFVEDTSSGGHYVTAFASVTSGTAYTISVYVKASGRSWVRIAFGSGFASTNTWFDIANGTVGTVGATSATIQNAGNGWYRITATQSATSSTSGQFFITTETSGSGTSYTGDGTSGIFIWGAQLETGSTATAYQRVVTAFDVTQAGVPSLSYLQFDGSDDWLVSPTITPGIDKAQVFAGVRQLADTTGSIAETSADSSTNNGAFSLFTLAGADDVQLLSRGTTAVNIRHDGATEPFTAVYAGTADIAADGLVLRSNGTQVNQSTSDQGTGNYLAYPLYVGRRGGTTLPYNGRIYSLIVRFGANLDAATITQTENWVAGKTGITI